MPTERARRLLWFVAIWAAGVLLFGLLTVLFRAAFA